MSTSKNILFGVAVGDALGVPVEFMSREYLKENPVTGMRGYGTHNQPPGTWSDDTSLTLALAYYYNAGFRMTLDITDIARNFVDWKHNNKFTANGVVFDIGEQTKKAIDRLSSILEGDKPIKEEHIMGSLYDNRAEMTNGNGSLMRILPYIVDKITADSIDFKDVIKISALTHPHIRAAIACHIYLVFAQELGKLAEAGTTNKYMAYGSLISNYPKKYPNICELDEFKHFQDIINGDIKDLTEDDIKSTGYVVDTLKASIWCILKNDNYRNTVLAAVNLGDDTDTTGAVTGGLAGLLYGYENIPKEWINELVNKESIEDIAKHIR